MIGWLRTQIEADRATADEAGARTWRYVPTLNAEGKPTAHGLDLDELLIITDVGPQDDALLQPAEAIRIALHDPADVLARCEAELALLDAHDPKGGDGLHCPVFIEQTVDPASPYQPAVPPCRTLRLLAYGYRHRPGWDAAWVPD
ncbi:DUF6221 family protein [Nonomuraea sp. NBC_00507]|uniref:DUF6221 family protein n=1 Tax=Nonomuraea sp. NBC_00507 TaxID=2976002 RepID=UPI002E17C8A3